MGLDRSEIEAAADHVAIDRLQRHYADVVNRRAWGELDAVFTSSVQITLELVNRPTVELAGRDDFVAFIEPAMGRFGFFQFVILNSHIELWSGGDRDVATARIFMCELRTGPAGGERSEAFGLYRDRYERTASGWRIGSRRYRSLAHFPAGGWLGLPADLLTE